MASGGTGIDVAVMLVNVALGVASGVVIWALRTLVTGGKFTLQNFAEAALDSFLLCSAIAFICASVSAIKYAARSSPNPYKKLAKYVNIDNGNIKVDYNPLENITYTDKVIEQMKMTDFHGFRLLLIILLQYKVVWQ